MPAATDSARAPFVGHVLVSVVTREPIEFIDLTTALSRVVEGFGLREGVATVQTRHTTTGLMINEHEPLLPADIQAMCERLVPASAAYAHDDFDRRTVHLAPGERPNGHAHCRAALFRTSESVLVVEGQVEPRAVAAYFPGGVRWRPAARGVGGPRRDASPMSVEAV